MASVDNIDANWIAPGMLSVRAQLTGASSTYVVPAGKIRSVLLRHEGTNGATYTWTSSTITITGTNNDWVNILVVTNM